jgi:hypothetical protein
MLKMVMLTEEQKEEYINKRHEYTKNEVVELACLSNSLWSLACVMSMFRCCSDGRQEDVENSVQIFDLFELLLKPIVRFLNEDCPMREEADSKDRKETV